MEELLWIRLDQMISDSSSTMNAGTFGTSLLLSRVTGSPEIPAAVCGGEVHSGQFSKNIIFCKYERVGPKPDLLWC